MDIKKLLAPVISFGNLAKRFVETASKLKSAEDPKKHILELGSIVQEILRIRGLEVVSDLVKTLKSAVFKAKKASLHKKILQAHQLDYDGFYKEADELDLHIRKEASILALLATGLKAAYSMYQIYQIAKRLKPAFTSLLSELQEAVEELKAGTIDPERLKRIKAAITDITKVIAAEKLIEFVEDQLPGVLPILTQVLNHGGNKDQKK